MRRRFKPSKENLILRGFIFAGLSFLFLILAIVLIFSDIIGAIVMFAGSLFCAVYSIVMFILSKGDRNIFSAEIADDSSCYEFCPYCGFKTKSDHSYCKSCGKEMT